MMFDRLVCLFNQHDYNTTTVGLDFASHPDSQEKTTSTFVSCQGLNLDSPSSLIEVGFHRSFPIIYINNIIKKSYLL